ncbi:MAG: epoxyqueuosine reductase [Dorea sp.]|nr:epoxyqueuosine reductase [Dorea sp.]
MEKETELTRELKELLRAEGADLAGVGDLTEVPENMRHGLSVGISVAVKYPKEIIRGISELPTQEYRNWYGSLNEQLDRIVTAGADFLTKKGYQAIAKTRRQVGSYDEDCITELPHKTVATRAGLGWIGKCALLVTERYGSMVRISSILTDAPLTAAKPINQSNCGGCTACRDACPAQAIYGKLWDISVPREELFDIRKCRPTARLRSEKGFGKCEELCGRCIEICPYTRKYLNEK